MSACMNHQIEYKGCDKLENIEVKDALSKVGDRVDEIEKQLPVIQEKFNNMSELFQKNISVLDKLESSFQDNRLAMQAMTLSIENSGKEIAGIKQDVSSLKEERSLNVMVWLKNNFISIGTLIIILGSIIKKLI
jgi:chromosome segregation ATPase